jgi:hypothetical protein
MHEGLFYVSRNQTPRGRLFEEHLLGPHGATLIAALMRWNSCALDREPVDHRRGPGWIILRATWRGGSDPRVTDPVRNVADDHELEIRHLRYAVRLNLPSPRCEVGAERIIVSATCPPPYDEMDCLELWASWRPGFHHVDIDTGDSSVRSAKQIGREVRRFLKQQELGDQDAERISAEIVQACAPDALL